MNGRFILTHNMLCIAIWLCWFMEILVNIKVCFLLSSMHRIALFRIPSILKGWIYMQIFSLYCKHKHKSVFEALIEILLPRFELFVDCLDFHSFVPYFHWFFKLLNLSSCLTDFHLIQSIYFKLRWVIVFLFSSDFPIFYWTVTKRQIVFLWTFWPA